MKYHLNSPGYLREIQAESGGLSHRKMDETVADNEKVMGVTAKQKKTNRKFMNVCAVDTDQRAQKENLINAAADELMEHGAKNTRKKKRKKGSKTAKNTSEKLSECHGVKSDHENSDTCQKVALPGKRVCIKYTGRLKDGRVFETTVGGKPLRFRLGEGAVLAGLDISIDGMVVGEKKKLTIPPSLGFGEQMLWDIPPNSKLEFDLELIDVED